MRLLSYPFQKTQVLVALALLLSLNAPLVQYACGVTGETSTASTLVVETTGTDAAPCGTVSGDVHNRLCGESQSAPVCNGDACTTDHVEKRSVVRSETSTLQVLSSLSSGALISEEVASSRSIATSRSGPGADWSVREPNRISVRLRTLSFRL